MRISLQASAAVYDIVFMRISEEKPRNSFRKLNFIGICLA
jgi:hypothetical protein